MSNSIQTLRDLVKVAHDKARLNDADRDALTTILSDADSTWATLLGAASAIIRYHDEAKLADALDQVFLARTAP